MSEYQTHAISFVFILTSLIRQDLNCSVMTGSTRIVDHTTFSELKWTRYPFSSKCFVVPPGFKPLTHLLGDEFIEILKDVYALQCIRDNLWCAKENVISMAYIDNHQANIQSRLVGLSSHSSFSECCHLALYLCSTMLRCKIWRTSVIPVSQAHIFSVCVQYLLRMNSRIFRYNSSANSNK